MKPVKRENSNTTQATAVTGITNTTAGTTGTANSTQNKAFYSTQYKGVGKGAAATFLPSTTNNSVQGRNVPGNNYMTSDQASSNYDE